MNSPARPRLLARLARFARLFIPLAAALPAVAATVTLPVALDTPDLGWTSGGTPTPRLWLGQTDVSHDGADAARAPVLSAENDESWLETTVAAPGVLSWRWRLDSGADQASLLEVYVGDETASRQLLFQNTGWTAASETLTGSGPMKVRWRFSRAFASDNALSDTAYLDTVAFAPFTPPVLDAASAITARGFTVNWTGPAAATSYRVEIDTEADFPSPDFVAVAAPAASWTFAELQPLATYHFRVVANGPDLLEAASAAGSVTLPAVQRPIHDAFAAALAISGVEGTVEFTTLDATIEDGEPVLHDGSVWFTWTAPGAGRWRFTAAYTSAGALGSPALHAYSGTSLAGLSLLASHDGSGALELDVAAGVALRIAVDSYPTDAGPVRLAWTRLASHTPPANDGFAAAIRLTGTSGSTTGTNLHAGVETGEPVSTGAHTVWWRWTAPASGLARFDASASTIPATLSAFTGSTLAGLAPVGAADGVLSLPVTANTTYHLAVSGVGEAQGALSLAWTLTAASQTQTIAFTPIAERGVHDDPFQLVAAASSGLPVTFSLLSGPATLDGDLLTLTGASGTVKLRATQAGDGVYLPATQDAEFAVRPVPANDAFAAATPISGASGSASGNNLSASAQELDPFPARRSVWWAWTAPATGVLTLDTAGSAINTTLAVVTARSATDLQILAESGLPGVRAKLEVPVSAGVAYRIAVDSYDQAGAVALSWSFAAPTRDQTITFAALPDVGVDAYPVTLDAYSDSGLPVVVSLVTAQTTPGVVTLADGVLTFTGTPGRVTVRASQAGDSYFKPAQQDVSFNVLAPPANDAFAAAIPLNGASGATTGNTLSAGRQDFDPFPANHSVWWRWTAPATGVLTLDTAGSDIFTTLAVTTGVPGADYAILAESGASGVRAKLELPVAKGVTYRIAVDSYDQQGAIALAWSFAEPTREQTITFAALPDVGVDASSVTLDAHSDSGLPIMFSLVTAQTTAGVVTLSGDVLTFTGKTGRVTVRASQAGDAYFKPAQADVVFNIRPAPANDAFAAAAALSGSSGVVNGANVDASSEFADPYPASHSVWWRWTASSTGVLVLDTAGSAIFTTMGVFTGSSADALVPVAATVEPAAHARLEFPVEAGVTYRIAVDALDNAQGAIRLAWTFRPPSLVQTITLDAPADRVVGDEPFEVTATASSGLPVTLTVSGPATLADGVLTLTHQPGVVTLRATQPGDAYYKAAPPVVRTFKVAKAPAIKFAFSGLSRTYDGAAHSVDVVATPAPRFAEVALTYSGPGYPASAEPPVRAGTYTVTATADGSKQTAKLVIAKAPLTVTAIDRAKLAGAPLPDFPLEYTGFVGTDDADSLARKPVATTPAKATSPGGKTYPIRPSGGVSTDYAFTYVPGVLIVETLAGRYEAMLADPSSGLPVAKLVLAIAAGGNTWTGQLVTRTEPAAFPVKGPLVVDSDAGSSTGSVTVKRGANIYRLDLAILRDTRFQATLALGDTTLAATTDGRRVFVPAAKEKLSWTGAHTLLLRDPVPLDLEDARPLPAGLGHATAAIDAKGNLKLAGTLADGAKLTATLAPDDTGAYRLFALPYAKRLHSYVAGTLTLENHPDLAGRRYLPATDHDPVVWLKAALPSTTKPAGQDKSTRAGFALDLTASIDPWLPPVPKTNKANPAIITLAQRLGLATANDQPGTLALAYGPAEADFGALASELPDHLDLSVKNVLTLPANATKLGFTLTAATGAFKGQFTLIDQVPAPTAKNKDATKTEKRLVTFTGVLRQPPVGETAPLLGGGAFLLKPLSTAGTTESLSGRLLLAEP